MEGKGEKREKEDLEGRTLVLPHTIRLCRYSAFWTMHIFSTDDTSE